MEIGMCSAVWALNAISSFVELVVIAAAARFGLSEKKKSQRNSSLAAAVVVIIRNAIFIDKTFVSSAAVNSHLYNLISSLMHENNLRAAYNEQDER